MGSSEYTPELQLVRVPSGFSKTKIGSSLQAADYARQFWKSDIDIYESMFLLTLDRSGMTTGYVKISQGGVSATYVDVKIILIYAIENLADSIILFHNHPSGKCYPSEHDIALTNRVKEICSIVEIKVNDHIIMTRDSHYSFADSGKI